MNRTKSLLSIVAVSSAVLAAILFMNIQAPKPQVIERNKNISGPVIPTTEVLVAARDLSVGSTLKPTDMVWKVWPKDGISSNYIKKEQRARANQELSGMFLRQALTAGEPINVGRLIKSDGGGYMAAILPSGMRAVSMTISPEAAAGGFILPNDHVDVLLTRKKSGSGQSAVAYTETILSNVKILAIDQLAQEKETDRSVLGRTATVELTPQQAETIAMSRGMGELSLALRSMADRDPKSSQTVNNEDVSSMTIFKYGFQTKQQIQSKNQ